jgi:hypothetical protein
MKKRSKKLLVLRAWATAAPLNIVSPSRPSLSKAPRSGGAQLFTLDGVENGARIRTAGRQTL